MPHSFNDGAYAEEIMRLFIEEKYYFSLYFTYDGVGGDTQTFVGDPKCCRRPA